MRRRGGGTWIARRPQTVMGGDAVPRPAALTDFTATVNLDGSVDFSWTPPSDATQVYVRYNIGQAAGPDTLSRGITLGSYDASLGAANATGQWLQYGKTYRFSAWTWILDGGFSAGYDEDSATGPLNPDNYGTVHMWLDARRETGSGSIATPDEFGPNSLGLTQATGSKQPTLVASGINGLPSYDFDRASAQQWTGGTDDPSTADGLSIFALCQTSNNAVDEHLITRYEDGGEHQFRLGKLNGVDYICTLDDTGSGSSYVQGGGGTTGVWSVGAVWEPSVGSYFYTDGALDDTDTGMNFSDLHAGTSLELRVGTERHSAGNPWDGQMVIGLIYGESLLGLAGSLLGGALATIGGK